MNLIYFGEKYRLESEGAMGSFVDEDTGVIYHWHELPQALADALEGGTAFSVRNATEEEMAVIEAARVIETARRSASFHLSSTSH